MDSVNKYKVGSVECDEAWGCSICMEPWSSQGDHQVSCLPCGHVYGFSCITKRKRHPCGHSNQCPQCNSMFKIEDVRKLYATPAIRNDDSLIQKVRSLEAENENFKNERRTNEELHMRFAAEQEAHNLQLSDIVQKLGNERQASYEASTFLQNQLERIIAERNELSKRLLVMEMLVDVLKDRLKVSHASTTPFCKYTAREAVKLQNGILDKLRELEVRAYTAEDLVVQLKTQILEQRALIAETGARLLSSQSNDGGNTSKCKVIPVREVVQLLLDLSKVATVSGNNIAPTSRNTYNYGSQSFPIMIDGEASCDTST